MEEHRDRVKKEAWGEGRITRCYSEIAVDRIALHREYQDEFAFMFLALAARNDEIRGRERDPCVAASVTKTKRYRGTLEIIWILVCRGGQLTLRTFDRLRLHPSANHAPSALHSTTAVSLGIVVPSARLFPPSVSSSNGYVSTKTLLVRR